MSEPTRPSEEAMSPLQFSRKHVKDGGFFLFLILREIEDIEASLLTAHFTSKHAGFRQLLKCQFDFVWVYCSRSCYFISGMGNKIHMWTMILKHNRNEKYAYNTNAFITSEFAVFDRTNWFLNIQLCNPKMKNCYWKSRCKLLQSNTCYNVFLNFKLFLLCELLRTIP